MKKILFSFFALALAAFIFSSCNNHGEKVEFTNLEIYYKDGASKEDAEKLGKYLEPHFKNNKETVAFQVVKNGENYVVKMVVKEGAEKDESVIATMREVQKEISAVVYDNKPVDFHLCDGNLETKKELKWEE